ncbi:D-alanine--D-alanine ligase [bacterium]|nr:D-alanine--D-alanine ligase [candidate division CSSED10-310 bacterium]
MKRMRIAVLFGGKSGEHEVSLVSASAVLAHLDREKYEPVPVAVRKDGGWVHHPEVLDMMKQRSAELSALPLLVFDQPGSGRLRPLGGGEPLAIDLVFPVLHGTYGEDGTVQGLLELADIPYVGSGVVGAAVGMDKIIMKMLFHALGFRVTPFLGITRSRLEQEPERVLDEVETALRFPVFVKPANLGSSVGVVKVNEPHGLFPALFEAGRYDRRIIVEQGVASPREIEISVLGNEEPMVSVIGEVRPSKEFYDYEAKYVDNASELIIPAVLSEAQRREVEVTAVRAFRELDLAGLARVDFLIERESGAVYLSEVNTMPGFTSISMYPRLWAAAGLSYPEILNRLIELALDRYEQKRRTSTSVQTAEWFL